MNTQGQSRDDKSIAVAWYTFVLSSGQEFDKAKIKGAVEGISITNPFTGDSTRTRHLQHTIGKPTVQTVFNDKWLLDPNQSLVDVFVAPSDTKLPFLKMPPGLRMYGPILNARNSN